MKNLKKVLAVMTAVTAMAASTSAFAANIAEVSGEVAGTYADGKLSVTTPAAADTTKGDMTLLVLTEGALADDTVADSEILYIDQGTAGFAGLGLKTDVLGAVTAADGHIIKVGYYDANGNFAIAEGYIKVSADEPQFVEVLWGDIDSSGAVGFEDSAAIVKVLIGGTADTPYTINAVVPETEVLWGDIDSSGAVGFEDSAAIVKVLIGGTADTPYTINTPVQLPKVSE